MFCAHDYSGNQYETMICWDAVKYRHVLPFALGVAISLFARVLCGDVVSVFAGHDSRVLWTTLRYRRICAFGFAGEVVSSCSLWCASARQRSSINFDYVVLQIAVLLCSPMDFVFCFEI